MAKIDYYWSTSTPSKADVYMTRLDESKVHSIRYWNGERWFDIASSQSRARSSSTPFTWPRGARLRRPPLYSWAGKQLPLTLRKITAQDRVQWGEPFKVFDPAEVLAWLVKNGQLPADWRNAYQEQMRQPDGLYFLQDTRSFVGNCPVFWRHGGNGYTTRLDEAARLTFDDAMRQHRMRGGVDLPWLCSELDPLRRPTLDLQYMPRNNAQQARDLANLNATRKAAQ